MSINETVLEMHFHKTIMDVFRNTLGLGSGSFNFYKYSPQRECFVGFDQAFVQTDLSGEELFEVLKSSAQTSGYRLSSFFVGFFMQFKVVKLMQNRSRHTPRTITNRPYCRVSLDTQKNIKTGFSQHELLFNLNRNHGAFVYYACPMMFDHVELYNNPDLNLLRLVDISSCPSIYSDNESHFIYFNDIGSVPVWRSEPVEGKTISPTQMVEKIGESIKVGTLYQAQLNLLDALARPPEGEREQDGVKLLDLVHDSLTILQFSGEMA